MIGITRCLYYKVVNKIVLMIHWVPNNWAQIYGLKRNLDITIKNRKYERSKHIAYFIHLVKGLFYSFTKRPKALFPQKINNKLNACCSKVGIQTLIM